MASRRLDVPRLGTTVDVGIRKGIPKQVARDSDGITFRSERPIRRRLLMAAGLLAAVVVLLMAPTAWLGVKASAVSASLQSAAQLLPQLEDEILRDDAVSAAATVDELEAHTSNAREATGDPIWTIAAGMPWIGSNFQAVTEIATSADDLARLGADPLVSVLGTVDWKALTPGGKDVNFAPLNGAEPKLASAANAVRQSSDRLNRIDASSLSSRISAPLIKARQKLGALSPSLDAAADMATVLPNMMGENSKRRYLLLVQNNAESRASGGIPGALAVLNIDRGKLTLGSQSTASALGIFTPPIASDSEQESIYSVRLGKYMQDVNLTPDFPTTARLAKAMWEKKMGERLDGVISVDPVALSYLLDVTGPVKLTDPRLANMTDSGLPSQLTAKNVVPTLLSEVYSRIAEPARQDDYFAGAAQKTFEALSGPTNDAKALLHAVNQGADEDRILIWSSHGDEQSIISGYRVSGSISGPSVSPSEFGVYFNDGTGAKMDFYVKRQVKLIKMCPKDGYSQVTVRIISTNTAPADAATSLPKYVTGGGAFGVPAGSVQTNIVAYGPVQSNVQTAVVDGKKVSFGAQRHGGRPVGTVTVRLAPGESSSVEFAFDKIVQNTEPQLAVTPTVQALKDVVLDTISEKCVPPA